MLRLSDNASDLEAAGRATDGPEVCPTKPRAEYLLYPLESSREHPCKVMQRKAWACVAGQAPTGHLTCNLLCNAWALPPFPGSALLSSAITSTLCSVSKGLEKHVDGAEEGVCWCERTAGLGQADPSTSPDFVTYWLCGHVYNNPTEPQ